MLRIWKNKKGDSEFIFLFVVILLVTSAFFLLDMGYLGMKQIAIANYNSKLANQLMIQGGLIGSEKKHNTDTEAKELGYGWLTNDDIVRNSKDVFRRLNIRDEQWTLKVTDSNGRTVHLYEEGVINSDGKLPVKFKEVGTIEIIYRHDFFFVAGYLRVKDKVINIKTPFVSDYFESY